MLGTLSRLLGPSRREVELPAPVRAAIRDQEERTEILIGWVQLGLVVVFSVLYALIPKEQLGRVSDFEPVPAALAAYLVFTLIRLRLAYLRRLRDWMLFASIVIDIALLFTLIWSFHIQYGQPASFYLKGPQILYVFIFIALRALRFDPRFVLTAGLVAAAGWVALVAYAMLYDPADMMVTRSYVEYMTGNAILIGAEVDKILSILVVAAVLTAALARGRRLLLDAVLEGQAVRDLSRFFAPEVAARIRATGATIRPGHGEARDAAILMVDLRGFSAMSHSMHPDDVIALLAEYQARVVPPIRAAGGAVDKFMGDGIMATFGAVAPSPRCTAEALEAVEGILAATDAWNADRAAAGLRPLAVNCAVADGRIVFGAVGHGDRLELTAIGDAVNTAAKLEKQNKAEGTSALITHDAYEVALSQGYVPKVTLATLPRRHVPGIEEPVNLLAVGGIREAATAA
jgi:adenylate cyclase